MKKKDEELLDVTFRLATVLAKRLEGLDLWVKDTDSAINNIWAAVNKLRKCSHSYRSGDGFLYCEKCGDCKFVSPHN